MLVPKFGFSLMGRASEFKLIVTMYPTVLMVVLAPVRVEKAFGILVCPLWIVISVGLSVLELTTSENERIKLSDTRFKVNDRSSGKVVSGLNADAWRLLTFDSGLPVISTTPPSATVRKVSEDEVAKLVEDLIAVMESLRISILTTTTSETEVVVALPRSRVKDGIPIGPVNMNAPLLMLSSWIGSSKVTTS